MLDDKIVLKAFHDGIEKDAAAAAVATHLLRSAGTLGRRLLGRFGRKAVGITVKPRTGMNRFLFGKGMTIGQRSGRAAKSLVSAGATAGAIGAGGIGVGALRQPRPLPPGLMR